MGAGGGSGINTVSPCHSTTSDLPMILSSMIDCWNPLYDAVTRRTLILVLTQGAEIWRVPLGATWMLAAVTHVISQLGI
jgi:hypothetical protein